MLAEHFANVGGKLDGAVEAYNKAVGSMESGVLVNVRKLKELGAGTEKEFEEVKPIEKVARTIQAPELFDVEYVEAQLLAPTQPMLDAYKKTRAVGRLGNGERSSAEPKARSGPSERVRTSQRVTEISSVLANATGLRRENVPQNNSPSLPHRVRRSNRKR